ncbi:hypothetical protein J6590_008938 [Homalodisca vitripennis]|nr:hypothetical protein J6590_008938 [Homalodisca vitripennis]
MLKERPAEEKPLASAQIREICLFHSPPNINKQFYNCPPTELRAKSRKNLNKELRETHACKHTTQRVLPNRTST